MVTRKPVVSVFGSNIIDDPNVTELAEGLGKLIVDLGCRVCTGGLTGVMEAVSKGARTSSQWTGSEVIGIIPQDDPSHANEFVDVVIPTGLGLYRNIMVARAGDACIAISGGTGTLSEMAFAWQLGKPLAAMSSTGGWAAKLAGESLDQRRTDHIEPLPNLEAAKEWLTEALGL